MFIKNLSRLFLNKIFLQKLVAYLLLILAFYLFRDFLWVFFLTFVFSYLFLTLWKFLKEKFDNFIEKIFREKKIILFVKKFFWLNIIIIFEYLIFFWILIFTLSDLLPKITKELTDLSRNLPFLSEQVSAVTSKLEEIRRLNTEIGWSITQVFSSNDYEILLKVWERLKTAWFIFLQVFISLILSYIFIIDKDKLKKYLEWIKTSNFWFLYDEYKIVLEKIVRSFWLIFKAQSIIALVNAIITSIWLIIIWFIHTWWFPFIYAIAIIVFIFWFIPVFGTFISSIPILIIAFTIVWGYQAVIEVILLIAFVHAVEAYYLNPKIVSSFMELPVSLTFLILFISEHFFWFAWLIIWVSSFYLIIELLKDGDRLITKSKIALNNMREIKNETKKSIKNDIRVSRKVDL